MDGATCSEGRSTTFSRYALSNPTRKRLQTWDVFFPEWEELWNGVRSFYSVLSFDSFLIMNAGIWSGTHLLHSHRTSALLNQHFSVRELNQEHIYSDMGSSQSVRIGINSCTLALTPAHYSLILVSSPQGTRNNYLCNGKLIHILTS